MSKGDNGLGSLLEMMGEDGGKELAAFGIKAAEGMIDVILEGNILNKTAKIYRQFYQELIKEGFTPDQALTLTTKYRLPGEKE